MSALAALRASLADIQSKCGAEFDSIRSELSHVPIPGPLPGVPDGPSIAGLLRQRVTIAVFSSDPDNDPAYAAGNVINAARVSVFCSNDVPNQWLCYDLGAGRIRPSGYLLRSANYPRDSAHPKSWVLFGSNDSIAWTELDRRIGTTVLNGPRQSIYISLTVNDSFRLLRLQQIGRNHLGSHTFSLSHFDVFGDINTVAARGFIEMPRFDSELLYPLPTILENFCACSFRLLWRGSRDGFRAATFHARCDGHERTITVVRTKDGNIFGGFTPIPWNSHAQYQTDDECQSFLFTIKNPHNHPPTKFPIRPENRRHAILGYRGWGPVFGGVVGSTGHIEGDLVIGDDCHENGHSFARGFGTNYVNSTGINGAEFFAGVAQFGLVEIEVFEIVPNSIELDDINVPRLEGRARDCRYQPSSIGNLILSSH